VQWSGAHKRPISARHLPSGWVPSDHVPGSERNHTTPVRIELAKSGDLPLWINNGELSFELKSGRNDGSAVDSRTWAKGIEQRKVAVGFTFPHCARAIRYRAPARFQQ
jgi:hypothetical protein